MAKTKDAISTRTQQHIVDICIDWDVSGPTSDQAYYSILPLNWSPRVRSANQAPSFADLARFPGIATLHPLHWSGRYTEELRRFTMDTRGAREQGAKLLVQMAVERCAREGKDAAAEITTGDIKNALAMWRAGLGVRETGEMKELRWDLAEIVQASWKVKEELVEKEESVWIDDDLEREMRLEGSEMVDEDEDEGEGEGGVSLEEEVVFALPIRVKKEAEEGMGSDEMNM